MTRISKQRAVDVLVERKFPGSDIRPVMQSRSQPLDPRKANDPKKYHQDAHEYRDELMALDDQAFSNLFAEESARFQAEVQERLQKEEEGRFFNLPSAQADFEYWGKAAYWTLDEAVALVLGRAPESVTWERVKKFVDVSRFAREFARLRELVDRADRCNKISNPDAPSVFLNWARQYGIDVPDALTEQVDKFGATTDWEREYEALKVKHDALFQDYSEAVDLKSRYASESDSVSQLRKSRYWQELERKAVNAINEYPTWRETQTKVQKTGNLIAWLTEKLDLDSREAEITKKVLTEIFRD